MNLAMSFHCAMKRVHDAIELNSVGALAAVDLNLLVTFDALARERNVTRAAEQLGVTQSAISHALRRLREMFDDPLLVRGRGGMLLTPRADALVVPLRSALLTLGRAIAQPSTFDARSARRSFRIASPDLFDLLVIPALLEHMREQAPGVEIGVVPLEEQRLADRLETGELDVAVVPQMDDPQLPRPLANAPGLVRRSLFRDRFVCLMRADHPALHADGAKRMKRKTATRRAGAQRASLTLETYAQLSHVLVSPSGTGPGMVDTVLASRGLQRHVALRIPAFYSALLIIARSDLILTAPASLIRLARPDQPVVALPAPLPLSTHSLNLVWHERFTRDAGHEWLRTLLTARTDKAVGPLA